MRSHLLKKNFFHRSCRHLILMAISCLVISESQATDWFVNDGSTTGDIFTSTIGNDANPGTAALPFATMQFAITAAAAGDVIYVDAGTYSGDVFVTKALILRGAKFGIPAGPAANPAGRGTDETILGGGFGIYYGQSVDNITIDGFTIDLGTGIRGIEARGLNCVIINNIVIGINNPLIQQAGISTRANAPLRLHSYLVQYNNVKNCRNGFFFDGNLENPSEFSFNYASGGFTSGFQIVASNGHLFKANTSENNAQGLLTTKGNLTIEGNTFRNNTTAGVRLAGTPNLSGNKIQYNYFENNAAAIILTDPNAAAINNEAHYNSLTGNTVNIGSLHTANFNATCNWYGTTDIPTITATITGDVTFIPFLSDGVDSDPVLEGFQPITTCIVVPVTLTSFAASLKNYDVLLNWQTSTEANSSHYIIEKSADSRLFTPVGRVEAKGYSDTRVNYTFTDNKATYFDRPTYYRLAMYDRDGSRKYSEIISVTLKSSVGSFAQSVYPSPARSGSIIKANFISSLVQEINVSMINTAGQIIWQKTFAVTKGSNQLEIQVPSAITGVHYFVFRSVDQIQQVPVIIQ